jgi:hypothetical protein
LSCFEQVRLLFFVFGSYTALDKYSIGFVYHKSFEIVLKLAQSWIRQQHFIVIFKFFVEKAETL